MHCVWEVLVKIYLKNIFWHDDSTSKVPLKNLDKILIKQKRCKAKSTQFDTWLK